MRLARIRTADGVVTGEYEDGTVDTVSESYIVGDDAELLAPCEPSALYCVGRNYATTNDRIGYERPERPDWFINPPVSVRPHGAVLPYPDWTNELTYAGELTPSSTRTDMRLPFEYPYLSSRYTRGSQIQ